MDEINGGDIREKALEGGENAREAFRLLWEAYYRRLMYFAASYQGLPRSDHDDLVSDILIKAFTAIGKYDPHRALSPWIYRIAANHFSDARNKLRRISTLPVGPAEDGGPSIEPSCHDPEMERVEQQDMIRICRDLIDTLEEGDRRIAYLTFFEQMNAAETGKALGIPPGTVRWKIHVLRKKIAALLGD